jgi:hypothetical protein
MYLCQYLVTILCIFSATTTAFPLAATAGEPQSATEWPPGVVLDFQLKLSATITEEGHPKVSGELTITNTTDDVLTIQKPTNRLALAFLVFDSVGYVVSPRGIAKVDPDFATTSLPNTALEPTATAPCDFG